MGDVFWDMIKMPYVQEPNFLIIDCPSNKMEMMPDVIKWTKRSLKKYDIEQDIAAYLQNKFDKFYYPHWQVVLGADFGSCVSSIAGKYFNYKYRNIEYLIYQT